MTKKVDLHVVKANTTVDDALEALVEKRITGFPVIDDDYKLVGVVSDYDLLALDSISGGCQNDTNLFPNVDSSWKTFNQLQKLLSKNNGKVVGDLMTPNPLVVYETTNLEDAVKLLLETKYRRLPVVDDDGKLCSVFIQHKGLAAHSSRNLKLSRIVIMIQYWLKHLNCWNLTRSGMAPHWCETRAPWINASAGFFLNGIMKGTATISLSRMRRHYLSK
ncbi:hypothetical protein OIU76_020082 [Salix suchowensis]|nr:hypothetical protein OIU76_020082 [Salix suchowensis]